MLRDAQASLKATASPSLNIRALSTTRDIDAMIKKLHSARAEEERTARAATERQVLEPPPASHGDPDIVGHVGNLCMVEDDDICRYAGRRCVASPGLVLGVS